MAFASVNGSPILAGIVSLPRIGIWTADVELPVPDDGSKTLTGPAVLLLGADLTLRGTFGRTGVDGRGRLRAQIVGGKAGLGNVLAPKSYLSATLRLPLLDILTDAGESLSAAANASTLAFQMAAWSRMRVAAGVSLNALVDAAGAIWRVLPDGTVWVGVETWPASSMRAVAISYEPEAARRVVASISPTVLPGQTFGGERIAFVQHSLTPQSVRTMLQTEVAA